MLDLLDKTEKKMGQLQRHNNELMQELMEVYQDQLMKSQQLVVCFELIDSLAKICEDFNAKNGSNYGLEGTAQYSKLGQTNGNPLNTYLQQIQSLYSRLHAKRVDVQKLVKKNKHDRTYFEKQIANLSARISLFKTNFSNPEDEQHSESLR